MDQKTINEGNYFSDLEGLRIAIDMEERGHAFYRSAYDHSADAAQKALFAKLASDEAQHLRQFTELYQEVKTKSGSDGDEYLFDADFSKYLTALTAPHIFPKHKEITLNLAGKNAAEILNLAIHDEKEAVLFYDALAQNAKFDNTRKIFETLKREEQTHIVKLNELLAGLS